MPPTTSTRTPSLREFHDAHSADLLEKCRRFDEARRDHERRIGSSLHGATLTTALDRRIRVRDASGEERELICFDSNSYLHLHRHPRVIEAVTRALGQFGYGTPSAQLLCGTNRHLRELEEEISRFHAREDALVFSSGYAANLGTISALVRDRDLVVRDVASHASIHDGCRASHSDYQRRFPHRDGRALERILKEASTSSDCRGKLIVSDGVFSMNGDIASLPQLVRAARRHGAYLMVDEAHATGVVGPSGRGTEEHFGLDGEVDILMGTFSKAPGTIGGYVTGSRELISYLRFYARSAMFSAALPAALCAGVTEAFKIMAEEPEHRERLWRNVHALTEGLRQVGMLVPATPESAIVPVFMGDEALLWRFGAALSDAGIKAGVVAYPAVPEGEAIIRLTVNARHTQQDIEQTVAVFARLGRKHGIVHESHGEIRAVGGWLAAHRGAA